MTSTRQILELTDFRARVAALYVRLRNDGIGPASWERWCADRRELLTTHPQGPFHGPDAPTPPQFWPYDPSWHVIGTVREEAVGDITIDEPDGVRRFVGVGLVDFVHRGEPLHLPLYRADSYGGGLFLPFRDATTGDETFGSGRYLLDGAKSADLGAGPHGIVLDFNFAYHPSCVWGDWTCPLPTPASTLAVPVHAGERAA